MPIIHRQDKLTIGFLPSNFSGMSIRTSELALGSLELAVLEHLWEHGAAEVKSVSKALRKRRRSSHNSIQAAMERLYRKGLLSREKVSHAYLYAAKVERGEFISRVIEDVLGTLSSGQSDNYLLAMVDYAAAMENNGLDLLETMIKRKRAAQKRKARRTDDH